MRYSIDGEILTGIADAIREKTGDDSTLRVAAMAEAIAAISGGGGDSPYTIASGEFTPTSALSSVTLEYENIANPLMFAIWMDEFREVNKTATGSNYVMDYNIPPNSCDVYFLIGMAKAYNDSNDYIFPICIRNTGDNRFSSDRRQSNVSRIDYKVSAVGEESLTVAQLGSSYYPKFRKNYTYKWVVIG